DGIGVAIGADAAASRHGTDESGQLPLADALDLYIGCRAIHMERFTGAAHAPVMGRAAIAGGDDGPSAVMGLDGPDHAHERGLQATHVHALALLEQSVR